MDSTDVKSASRRVGDHPALEAAARVGYAVNGVLHIVIGVIALQLAFGSEGTSADQSGALGSMADNGVRARPALGRRPRLGSASPCGRSPRPISGGWRDERPAQGGRARPSSTSSCRGRRSSSRAATARRAGASPPTSPPRLMKQPAGQWLVAAVGLAIIGVGVYHVVKGWKKKFLQDLETHPGEWIVRAGRFGYIAKGVALAIVGGLFVLAAVRHQAE